VKVILSALAVDTLENILDHIEENWSIASRNKALKKVLAKFDQISSQPRSCLGSDIEPNIFKCVVSKQTSFFYRINANKIEVIIFYDNRQDPKNIIDKYKRKND